MAKPAFVQAVLDAYIGLLTQPFDQDLKASKRVAAAAITLPLLPGLTLANDGSGTAAEIGGFSLVLVLAWAASPAIFGKPERKELAIARNLRVVSFWIAVTLLFVIPFVDRELRRLGRLRPSDV